jgi:hypothetical protein
VPCAEWTGHCPSAPAGECRGGCGTDRFTDEVACPLAICRENYPKRVGDSCGTDQDCLPTPARPRSDSPLVDNVYLRCDATTSRCVARAPVVVTDWLAPCNPQVIASIRADDRALGTYGGMLDDPGCSEGVCAFESHFGESCVRQGCSKRCLHDGECPEGASCTRDDRPGCTNIAPPPAGYCKPGSRLSLGVGFTCP